MDRRLAGLPLEHVIGWAEFCGLKIQVDPGVFVPRRRSEFLVAQAVLYGGPPARPHAPQGAVMPRAVVLDMCCGSGAIGLAVASVLGRAELHAADIDATSIRCAIANLGPYGGSVYQGDLYDALPDTLRGTVDVLVANAPYVPTTEVGFLPAEARLHEALVALDGGADGVHIQRRIAAGAGDWLAPRGHLLIETSQRQAPLTAAAMTSAGFRAKIASHQDLDATVVIGSR